MNFLSFLGDVLHLASFLILLIKMFASRSAKGISLKSQLLYAIVFFARYLDIRHFFVNVFLYFDVPPMVICYLTAMKIIFIALSLLIVYMIYSKPPWSKTYNKEIDKVRIEILIVPCLIMALLWNDQFTFQEIMYKLSLWLEAVAIVPQLFMVHKLAKTSGGFVENLTSHYVFTLGGYRVLYLFNWIFRMLTETGYWEPILWITGIIQTSIYCDFFYHYITCQVKGNAVMLPI